MTKAKAEWLIGGTTQTIWFNVVPYSKVEHVRADGSVGITIDGKKIELSPHSYYLPRDIDGAGKIPSSYAMMTGDDGARYHVEDPKYELMSFYGQDFSKAA